MSYIPSIYKFAHPVRAAYRLECISQPFDSGNLEIKLREPWKSIYKEVQKTAAESKRGILPLEFYRRGHQVLVENLDELKRYDLIIVPGVSVNITEEENILGEKPASLGMDFFSNNIRLPNDIFAAYQLAFDKYVKDTGKEPQNYKHELLLPLAHFFMPLRILHRPDGVFGREALFKSELEAITKERHEEGKIGFGTLTQWSDVTDEYALEGVEANYEFSERMYVPSKAKDFYYLEDKKTLERYAFVNCYRTAKNLLRILLKSNQVFWFAKKTDYMSRIKARLPQPYKNKIVPIGGDEGIMRNAELSRLGASDISAVRIFAGFLYRKWLHENKQDVRPRKVGVPNGWLSAFG